MECVSVACLASGSAGASIPAGGGPGVAVTSDGARAERFAEMLQAEPQRVSVYVAAPDVAPNGSNPLVSVMSQFQQLELPTGLHASDGRYEKDRIDPDASSGIDALQNVQHEAMLFQAEMVRVSMAMAVMSSAKQGVTTLFQQQG